MKRRELFVSFLSPSNRHFLLLKCLGRSRPDTLDSSFVHASFDHLVSAGEQRCGNFDAERLSRLQVDDEFESSRQLDRHLGWFLAVEDAADVDARLAKLVRKVRSVAHQPTSFGKLAPMV